MATTTIARTVRVRAQPITAENFAPYGRLVTVERGGLSLREGHFTARLMTVERVPQRLNRINRHLDHTQLFIPLGGAPFAVFVAPPDEPVDGFDPSNIAAFTTDGQTAVIFHVGTWHIEPRSLQGDTCQLVNVQSNVSPQNTELIAIEDELGMTVELAV